MTKANDRALSVLHLPPSIDKQRVIGRAITPLVAHCRNVMSERDQQRLAPSPSSRIRAVFDPAPVTDQQVIQKGRNRGKTAGEGEDFACPDAVRLDSTLG